MEPPHHATHTPPSRAADRCASQGDGDSPSRARRVLEGIRHLIQSLRERSTSDENDAPPGGMDGALPGWGSAPPPGRSFLFRQSSGGGDSREMVIESVEPREEDCPVCLSSLSDECVKTPCGHYFHKRCLEQYFVVAREPGKRARCPLCRGALHAPLPVEASASSGRAIEVASVPRPGAMCHLDRAYTFRSLGGFASKPNMLYVITPNEDRKV